MLKRVNIKVYGLWQKNKHNVYGLCLKSKHSVYGLCLLTKLSKQKGLWFMVKK